MGRVKGNCKIEFHKRKRNQKIVRLSYDYKSLWGAFLEIAPKTILVIAFSLLLLDVGCIVNEDTIASIKNDTTKFNEEVKNLIVSIDKKSGEIKEVRAELKSEMIDSNEKITTKIDRLEKMILELKTLVSELNASTNSKIRVISVPVSTKANTTAVIYE